MHVDSQLLVDKGLRPEDHRLLDWLTVHFPHGGEYQHVLNTLAEDRTMNVLYGDTVLRLLGSTGDDVVIDGDLAGRCFYCSGNLIVKGDILLYQGVFSAGDIDADGRIDYGWYISSGGHIHSQGDTVARLGIYSRGPVESGGKLSCGGLICCAGDIRAECIYGGDAIISEGRIRASKTVIAKKGIYATDGVDAESDINPGEGFMVEPYCLKPAPGLIEGVKLSIADSINTLRHQARLHSRSAPSMQRSSEPLEMEDEASMLTSNPQDIIPG